MDDLGVFLHVDILTGFDFRIGIHTMAGKQLDILLVRVMDKSFRRGTQVQQPAPLGFNLPFRTVSVAVEKDALMCLQLTADEFGKRVLKIRRLFQFIGKLHQFIRNRRVEHDVGAGNVEGRARHAELKLVARECKRRGAVAVGIILRNRRQGRNADIHALVTRRLVVRPFDQRTDDCRQLIADIHGHDCGRCFIRTQAMVVARAGDTDAQQILIFIDRLDNRRQEQQELSVLHRRRAGVEQVLPFVGRNRPVVVLAGTIDALKRFFMQ